MKQAAHGGRGLSKKKEAEMIEQFGDRYMIMLYVVYDELVKAWKMSLATEAKEELSNFLGNPLIGERKVQQ